MPEQRDIEVKIEEMPDEQPDPNMVRLLARGTCGHLCYRTLARPMLLACNGGDLLRLESVWQQLPCPVCEPAYALETLNRAEELIRQGWARGVLAETKHGCPVSGLSEKAARWNLLGAFQRARFDVHRQAFPDPTADPVICKLMNGIVFYVLGQQFEDLDDAVQALGEWQRDWQRSVEQVLAAFPRLRSDLAVAIGRTQEGTEDGSEGTEDHHPDRT